MEKTKGTILYVGKFNLPDKGASANRVVSNGKIFRKLGYQVAYLGVSNQVYEGEIGPLDGEKHMHEEAYPKSSSQWLKHMVSTDNIEKLADMYGDVKMIILYNAPYTLLLNTKKKFSKRGIKVVYDCTEWTGVTDGSLPKRAMKKIDEYFIRNKIHHKADGLIVISSMMEEGYKGCKHMVKLPPLIDLNNPIWNQKIERDSVFEFCWAGMLDGNKDSLDRLVEAYSSLEKGNVRLRIIGVSKEEFCDFYNKGTELIGNCKNEIIFMGMQPHKETIKYVSNCDCYIFIRQSDMRNNAGFPTKFSESFSCGVPIIATDISDVDRYMKSCNGKLLSQLSVETIREAMIEEMGCAGENGRSNYHHNDIFHYENYVDVCEKWFEEIFRI